MSRPALPKKRTARNRSGLAIITVVGTLALVTVLLLSVLSSANTEFNSSSSYAAGAAGQNLQDTAVNLVISQIRSATTDLGSDHSWASQPGMIRRYNATSADLEAAYKLYSSDTMIVGPNFDPAGEGPPSGWEDKPSIWTNLNRATIDPDSGFQNYPIVDPTKAGVVEGFALEPSANIPPDSAAMPLRWLYVLEDGTTGHLDDTGTFVPPPGGSEATESNPIQGRIAFWADDESSKVNVNTASEGVYWDHPLGNTRTERGNAPAINVVPQAPFGFASSMAVRYEFSRYPGHPAETSLSPILGDALTLSPYPTSAELETLYDLTPKVVLAGSKGGTIISHQAVVVAPDGDRLYPSVDDFLLKPDRKENPLGSDAAGTIERSKFFLTAHSRAPELNLFNRPRILLWPLYQESANRRNATENLLAFCASPNGNPYFFQRHSPSPGSQGRYGSAFSADLDLTVARNNEIYSYLNRLADTPVPGFGGKFTSKYPQDSEQIIHNALDWVRSSVNIFSRGLAPQHQFTNLYYPGVGEFAVVPMVRRGGSPIKGFGMNSTLTEAALVLFATEVEPIEPAPGEPSRATKARAFLIFETFKAAPGMPHQTPAMEIEVSGLDAFQLNGQSMQFPAVGKTYIEREQYGGGWGSFTSHMPLLLQMIAHGGAKYAPTAPPPFAGQDFRRHELVSVPVDLSLGGFAQDTIDFTGGSITVKLNTHPRSGYAETFHVLHFDFPSATWPVPRARTGITLPRPFNNRAQDSSVAGGGSYAGAPGAEHGKMHQVLGNQKDYRRILIEENDVVRSVEISAAGPSRGDYRFVAGRYDVPSSFYSPHPDYFESDRDKRFAHSLRDDKFSGIGMPGWNVQNDTPPDEIHTGDTSRPSNWSTSGALVENIKYAPYCVPITARGLNGALKLDGRPGDWENGLGILPDGPYVRRNFEAGSNQRGDGFIKHDSSYFLYGYYYHDTSGIDFAPNRQIASAVVFGGQPTGIHSGNPWQTLLFCPNPPSRTTAALDDPTPADHAGFGSPRDHHFLDLFWMPAVEPYAISEPFSTAGKINMNYELMPFRHIKRRTAIHAALKPLRIAAIPAEASSRAPGRPAYKDLDVCPWEFRYEVNTDPTEGTLRGFEERFSKGDLFRSASEICDIFLVPKKLDASKIPPGSSYPPGTTDPTYTDAVSWWQTMQLTGDNSREMPYNHLYPRLTTRSNTFRVHYQVQVLKKSRSSEPGQWDDARDLVLAEQRGSTLIERFISPTTDIPDFATAALPTEAVDDHYTFRILSTTRAH